MAKFADLFALLNFAVAILVVAALPDSGSGYGFVLHLSAAVALVISAALILLAPSSVASFSWLVDEIRHDMAYDPARPREIPFTVYDSHWFAELGCPQPSWSGRVVVNRDHVTICPDHMGLCGMVEGFSDVIMFEIVSGAPRLLVWDDINDEECKILPLGGALEDQRVDCD